MEGTGGGASLC